jgi:hypothetical protein
MSIFRCDKCGCIDNTATSNYWEQRYPFGGGESKPVLCTECDPEVGKWHGCFDKRSAKGLLLASDGFLYAKDDMKTIERMKLKVIQEITD